MLFLKFIDKHSTNSPEMKKLFNRNNLKVGSIEKIIVKHNKKIMERYDNKEPNRCTCWVKEECPLNRAWLTRDGIYEAKVISGGETKYYVGATNGDWKRWYYDHKMSLINSKFNWKRHLPFHGKYWPKQDHITEPVKAQWIKWIMQQMGTQLLNKRN